MYRPPQYRTQKYFKKRHKIKRDHNSFERRSNMLKFGTCGLQALEYGKLTARQIEAVRVVLRRGFNKQGNIKINVFPGISLTKKPVSARMGKGKGKPNKWVGHVFVGKILYEVSRLKVHYMQQKAKHFLGKAVHKLPVKARFVFSRY